MDPEYIGTTIKINILNTVEYGATNTSNGATPIISLICGRSCNYNLYVSGETSGVASAKTMADFYKNYPYNRQNLYPYAFEYLCANDAKYLGGIEEKNGTDITKQVNNYTINQVGTFEFMGVPSNDEVYVANFRFKLRNGLAVLTDDGSAMASDGQREETQKVRLTKWFLVNKNTN